MALSCRLGVSIDDLAYDTVVYLFDRNADRSGFPRLTRQFGSGLSSRRSNERILVIFRQAISSYLEGEIVRRVIESYPPIDRIHRNLRNAVAATPLLKDVRSGKDHWVAINGPEDLENILPIFPPPFLERMLLKTAGKRSTVTALVSLLSQVMRDQATYKPAIPLDALAVIIQNVYLLAGRRDLAGVGCPGEQSDTEFERTVLRSVAEVETRMRRRFIESEGVAPAEYNAYVHAATDILKRSLCREPEAGLSFCEILGIHMGNVSRRAYYEEHRARLEFVVTSARRRYFERVKNR